MWEPFWWIIVPSYCLVGLTLCLGYAALRPNRTETVTQKQVARMLAVLLLFPLVLAGLAFFGLLSILSGE